MNLYLLINNTVKGYDTYDSAVVVAPDFDTARTFHPHPESSLKVHEGKWVYGDGRYIAPGYLSWGHPKDLAVLLIGQAEPQLKAGEIICASYNAG